MKRAMTKTGQSIVLLFLLFIVSPAFAQYTLKGKVTDETGNPLYGASVVLEGTYQGVSVNSHGEYQFDHLRKGKYHVKASFIGYKSGNADIEIYASQQLNFKLSISQILTDEVIVSGVKAGSKTPVAVTNIGKDKLEKLTDGQDVPFLLSSVPSLVQSSEPGIGMGYTSMRIRGTDPTRINVTVNGIPLNDSESQGVYWVDLPDLVSSVDNIQIQRGLGTSTNGSAAFGATVNLQTETLNQDPYAELQGIAGSFNTYKQSIKTGTGLINGKFTFDARYSQQKTDGYVDRTYSNHRSFFATGAYLTSNSITRFNVIHGEEHTGISWWGNPDPKSNRTYNPAGEYTDANGKTQYYDNQSDNYIQTHYHLIHSSRLTDNWTINAALHYTRGEGYYEEYEPGMNFSDYGLSNLIINGSEIKTTDLIQRKWMANDFYGGVFSTDLKLNKLNLTLGGSWNRYDGNHFGRILWMQYAGPVSKDYQWYLNHGKKTDYNFYAKADWRLSEIVHAYGDLQFRHISYKMDGPDDDLVALDQNHAFNFFNPKFGLFADLNNQNQVYGSVGIGHREPARSDFQNAKGDPSSTPKSEALYDFEAGYNFKSTVFSAGANLYYMYYHNQLVPTGQKSNVGYDIMTNVRKSYRAGIELTAAVKILSSLHWDGNMTLSRNRIKNFTEYSTYYSEYNNDTQWYDKKEYKARSKGNTDIAYSPDVIAASTFAFEPCSHFDLKLISKYVGKQYFDNTSSKDRQLDAYFVNNLRTDYNFTLGAVKKCSLFLQVNNLFNSKYESNAYGGNWYEEGVEKTWAYYFPQAGIHFLSGITLRF
ncbi:MAG: TonB-dependent receptor [Bacteroidota bacterium]|nr:TonB-dependent receptor [Bacteroidota bacterium]